MTMRKSCAQMDEGMQVSVKIMDIDIDMMSNDVFIQKMNEYLTEDSLDVILFASTGMLDRAVDDLEYQRIIKQAKLLLPGEEALLTTHHVDVLEAGGHGSQLPEPWLDAGKSQ